MNIVANIFIGLVAAAVLWGIAVWLWQYVNEDVSPRKPEPDPATTFGRFEPPLPDDLGISSDDTAKWMERKK
jgi:hypothetical protein